MFSRLRRDRVQGLSGRRFRNWGQFLLYGPLAALLGAFGANGGDLANIQAGGSGSARWQFATPVGLFVVDPAVGEIALQGATPGSPALSPALVIVNLDKKAPPADTTVTLNGIPLIPAFGSPTVTGTFTVDPAGPQPIVGAGGAITLVVASASAGAQRQLILPCPSDVAMTSTPPIGSNLAGHASVQLAFAFPGIYLNPTNPPIPALAGGPFPRATLMGYDPGTGRLPLGNLGDALVGAGQLGVTVPVVPQSTTSEYMMDVRWPGFWQPDGETGGFCGLAKRWTYLNTGSGLPVGREEVVPVVLKLTGITTFSSELTLANTGSTAVDLTLTYTSEPSIAAGIVPSGGSVVQRVEAGQQLVIGDVIAFLKGRGVPVAAEDVGTLRVAYTSTSASPTVFAQTRTTSPSGIGRAGVGYGAPSTASLGASKVAVYGLRQNLSDRSNMAVLNAGQSGPATFRLTMRSGDPGDARSVTLAPDVTLQPGEWHQIDRVLDQAGMTNGYATVERVSGTAPFVAYGVINDNGTNDGSFLEMSRTVLSAEPLIVPAIVETPVFETELTLSNPGGTDLVATLSYVESLPARVSTTPVTVPLLAGEQRIIPRVVDFLRTQSAGIGAAGVTHAGSLKVTFAAAGGVPAGGWAGARVTSAAAGAGRYGVSYAGVPPSAAAISEAFVTGLRQDGGTRSNLALVNVGDVGRPVTLSYEVYDGVTMRLAGQFAITLLPGEWHQFNSVLADFGVSNGYVRVLKVSGDDHFIAYGVVNDGGPVSPGTNDGSVVTMAGAR